MCQSVRQSSLPIPLVRPLGSTSDWLGPGREVGVKDVFGTIRRTTVLLGHLRTGTTETRTWSDEARTPGIEKSRLRPSGLVEQDNDSSSSRRTFWGPPVAHPLSGAGLLTRILSPLQKVSSGTEEGRKRRIGCRVNVDSLCSGSSSTPPGAEWKTTSWVLLPSKKGAGPVLRDKYRLPTPTSTRVRRTRVRPLLPM